MKRVNLKLKNCHGISELEAKFDFRKGNAAAIYAPNGTMKTSLARTFKDYSHGTMTTDHMFPDRETVRDIVDGTGSNLDPSDIVVISSYDEEVGPTESTSTLLVHASLRKEYESLQVDVNAASATLVSALKSQSNTRQDIRKEISLSFTRDEESFFVALIRVEEEIREQVDMPYAEIPYDTLFNTKIYDLLKKSEFREILAEYVTRLNEILDSSAFFDRENFSYYNASNITKSLEENGFFTANHKLVLHGREAPVEVTTVGELSDLIDAEKRKISEDAALRKKLDAIEKQLTKNIDTRKFYDFISERVDLLPALENIDKFKEEVWKSYFKANYSEYIQAVESYRTAESRKKEIEQSAAKESTQWERVIDIFNERFFVPFKLTAKNRDKVILGREKVLKLGFEFTDRKDKTSVERSDLLEVLSTGEKKALYILNVLFEVQARRNSTRDTLFVVDDIADSFDYKNKYAIIHYLKEMSEEENFKLIILTHNFDFFRTIESRFVKYANCFMAQKSSDRVEIEPAAGIKNPFINDYKKNFHTEAMGRVASIPFIRNLLEYTKGVDDADYLKLTSLLHWKSDTASIVQSELDGIFDRLFSISGDWPDSNQPVYELINIQAEEALKSSQVMNLGNKIILSIAIRLTAERHMIDAISDPATTEIIGENQTHVLNTQYRKKFPDQVDLLKILDLVTLMTPENIHVNSFMYEPIIDMADDHLRKLYRDISTAAASATAAVAVT